MSRVHLICMLGIVFLSHSCKEDECRDVTNPYCINYDPCSVQEQPTANFEILEYWPAGLNPDTLESFTMSDEDHVYVGFSGSPLIFNSKFDAPEIKHTWYIGSEIFHEAITPSRNFSNITRGTSVKVSHVIEYIPDSICFPLDDGYDSVVQTIYFPKRWSELNMIGTFKGVLDNQSDSFDITFTMLDRDTNVIDIIDLNSNEFASYNTTINFHNQGDTSSYLFHRGYDQYVTWSPGNNYGFFYDNTSGSIIIEDDIYITIEYVFHHDYDFLPDENVLHRFTGIKIE